MKIDKNKLVDLLVEKTSMEKAEVEKQLEQLIDRIIDAAHRGKALEIKEFGVFYFDDEGELKFDPSKELSTEISFKYAGMKPIELQPERDTAIPLGVDEDEEKVPEEQTPTADVAETEEAEKKEKREKDKDEADDIFGIEEDDEDFDFLSDAVKESEAEMDVWDEVEKEEEKEKKEKEAKKPKPQPKQKKKSSAGIWVIAALLLILLLAGLYFIFIDDGFMADEPQQAAVTEQPAPVPDEISVITDENAEFAEDTEMTPVEPEQEQQNAVSEEEGLQNDQPETITQPAVDEQSTYGLMGSINDEANNGYSIVLHSFNSEENARETAARLSEEGYRVLVSSRTVTGEPVWRVSVGQFETLAQAQENIDRLPSPYNVQNFIHRIQNN